MSYEEDHPMTLTEAFATWGKDRIRPVVKLIQRYGVICSSTEYSDGTKG